MDIKRSDFKHNFLRRLIFRLDYNGVLDISDVLAALEPTFLELGFVEVRQGYISKTEFELSDPIILEGRQSISIKELNKIDTFKYRDKNAKTTLEINKLYTSLIINTEDYIGFQYYCSIFTTIIQEIKKRKPYLVPIRLGLRKINDCVLVDKTKFEDYFNQIYFSDITKAMIEDNFNSEKINTEFIDTIQKNGCFFNYGRAAAGATISHNNKQYEGYQVVIDTDGYTHDLETLKHLLTCKENLEQKLIEINDNLFTLYKNTLTPFFREELTRDTFQIKDVIIE